MNHMICMGHAGQFAAPGWVLYTLAALFFAAACFYVYRLVQPTKVRAVYGYWDWENEIGHGICNLAMVTMLVPMLLPIPFIVWTWLLGLATVWFFARAVSWGRRVPYPTKWWWDWAHVGMLAFMAAMFAGASSPIFTFVTGAFWLWLAGYNANVTVRDFYDICHDFKIGKLLYIGSGLAHVSMSAVMFIMTMWPMALMPMDHNMPGMNASAVLQPAPVGVVVANDSNFHAQVFASQKPVVLLFFGGCDQCAEEVRVFDNIARQHGNRAKFVRINKDDNPNACQQCGVTGCPRVMIVSKGGITAVPSTVDVTDKQQLEEFIVNHVK